MKFADSYIIANFIGSLLAFIFAFGILKFPSKEYRYLLKPYRTLFILAALWLASGDGLRRIMNALTYLGYTSIETLTWVSWVGVVMGSITVGYFIPYLKNFGLLDRLEKLRHESEQKYYSLFDFSPLAMIQVNDKSEVQDWNKSAERVFGYTKSEMLGKKAITIFPDRDKLRAGVEDKIQRGETLIGRRIPTSGKRKSGEVFPVELSVSMFKVSKNNYFNVIVVDLSR